MGRAMALVPYSSPQKPLRQVCLLANQTCTEAFQTCTQAQQTCTKADRPNMLHTSPCVYACVYASIRMRVCLPRVWTWKLYTLRRCQGDKELLQPDKVANRPLPMRAPSWGSVESQSLAAPPGPLVDRQQPPLHLLSLDDPAAPATLDPLLDAGSAPRAAPAPELTRAHGGDDSIAVVQYFRHAPPGSTDGRGLLGVF